MATEKAVKAVESTTKSEPSKRSGPIAIVWRPELDSAVMKPPVGTQSDRPFLYNWVANPDELKQRRDLAERAFVEGRPRQIAAIPTKSLYLDKPGLHWVESALWDEAIAADGLRPGEGVIARLIREGALKELAPAGNSFKGSLDEYSYADACEIIKAETTIPTLMEWQKSVSEPRLVNRITNRIEELKGSY